MTLVLSRLDRCRRKRAAIIIIGISFGLSLSGCQSVWNPHIDIEDKVYGVENARPKEEVSFIDAEKYAHGAKKRYRKALGDQAIFSRVLGTSLIPLGAAALGLGITGASNTAVTALGLTGATGFGLGAWLQSTPAQKAYIAGYNATNCTIEAMLPLKADGSAGSKNAVELFKDALGRIGSEIAKTQSAVDKVRNLSKAETDETLKEKAEKQIADAETIIGKAEEAHRNGIALSREMDLAGNRIVSAVDRILGQVDLAIINGQPDLQALSTIIGGLGQSYAQFTKVPEEFVPEEEAPQDSPPEGAGLMEGADLDFFLAPPQREETLTAALNNLERVSTQLQSTTLAVAAFVNAVVAKKPLEVLAACGVDPELIAGDISVEPAGPLKFVEKKGGSQGFIIQGGRQPWMASLAESGVEGLSISQPELFGRAFVVKASDKTPAGEYSVMAADGAGHRKFLHVVVAAAKSKPDPASSNNEETKKQLHMELQKKLCVSADGDFKELSLQALTVFLTSLGKPEPDQLTDDHIKLVQGMSDDDVKKQCLNLAAVKMQETKTFTIEDKKFEIAKAEVKDGKIAVTWSPMDAPGNPPIDQAKVKGELARQVSEQFKPIKIVEGQITFENYPPPAKPK